MKQLRNGYFVGLISFIFLYFAGYGGLWLIFPYTVAVIFIAIYLILSQITCPTCGVQLLSRKAILSPDKCYNCGRPLNPKKPSKREVAETLIDKYQDERAARTQWAPLLVPSANFNNYKLHIDRKGRVSFKPTIGALFFSAPFLLIGIIFYTTVYFIPNSHFLFKLIPLFFVATGLWLLYGSFKPIRINQNAGLFVLGWEKNNTVPLSEISAIQLLSYKASSGHGGYFNYQINLVLKGGERASIVFYFSQHKAVADAEQLAALLGIPLWSDIEPQT